MSEKSENRAHLIQKGQVLNPNGRPKGAISERTKQWNQLADAITSTHTERFNQCLSQLEDKDFMRAYLEVLNYFKPKLSAVQSNNVNTELQALTLHIDASDVPVFPSNVSDRDGIQDAEIVE